MFLDNIYEIVDRSIFEVIRKALVELGYLPDITKFPDTDAGVLAYNQAMEAIKVSKGYAIEVFGQGSSFKKYEKKVPRIVYTARRIQPGDLGGNPDLNYELNGGSYDAYARPPAANNLQFEISLVFKEARHERKLNSIISATLSYRRYIKHYDDETQEFFINNISYRDNPDTAFGISEKILTYEAVDLWDMSGVEVSKVSKLQEVTITTEIDGQTNTGGDMVIK